MIVAFKGAWGLLLWNFPEWEGPNYSSWRYVNPFISFSILEKFFRQHLLSYIIFKTLTCVLFSYIAPGIIVCNTLVSYDRENARIGFWKTNCSKLRDTLNVSSSPPPPSLPSGMDNTNSTAYMTPALAPSEPLEYYAPGKKLFSRLISFVTVSMIFCHAFI